MPKSQQNKSENESPIKEYKGIHNFNLEKFYNSNMLAAKKITTKRQDTDYFPEQIETIEDLKAYNAKLIKEYSPWSGHPYDHTINIAPKDDDERYNLFQSKEDRPERSPINKKSNKGFIGTLIGVIIIILLKAKGLTLLLLAKLGPLFLHAFTFLAKFKGVLITASTMVATIFVYASMFKLELAVGLVLLIFLHEMGHALIIYSKGIRAGAPVFIPFIGAFIAIKDIPKDAITEAQIAIGGPLVGSLASFALFYMYLISNQTAWLYLAYIGFMMNLFNLTPVSPLDGGRIVTAISTKMWIIGFIMLLGFTFIFQTPALILVLFFAISNLLHGKKSGLNTNYYDVPTNIRLAFACGYFGLVLFLGYATYETNALLQSLSPH